MNTVKATQILFPLMTNRSFRRHRRKLSSSRQKSAICFSSGGDDSGSSGSSSSSEGDKRKQELLARIAMLQAQKVRLTDFLDERSDYLTQFAEDANAEFDEIGENALKELDEAGTRIMEKLEGQMQVFEETSYLNREEIEKTLEEFEDQIGRDRNEGLFFKNLQEKAPQLKAADAKVGEKTEKLTEIPKDSTSGSKFRKNIYLAFMSLLVISMANLISAAADIEWRKVAALGLIFMGFLSQFIYEQRQSLSSSTEETDKK